MSILQIGRWGKVFFEHYRGRSENYPGECQSRLFDRKRKFSSYIFQNIHLKSRLFSWLKNPRCGGNTSQGGGGCNGWPQDVYTQITDNRNIVMSYAMIRIAKETATQWTVQEKSSIDSSWSSFNRSSHNHSRKMKNVISRVVADVR